MLPSAVLHSNTASATKVCADSCNAQDLTTLQQRAQNCTCPMCTMYWMSHLLLQVNAAVGCLARMPLPQTAFRPIHHTSQPATSGSHAQQPLDRSRSRFGSEVWAPYLRDTALRVFGCVGVTGQLGHFCRPVLDFTAGLPCPCTAPALPLHCPCVAPALPLHCSQPSLMHNSPLQSLIPLRIIQATGLTPGCSTPCNHDFGDVGWMSAMCIVCQ